MPLSPSHGNKFSLLRQIATIAVLLCSILTSTTAKAQLKQINLSATNNGIYKLSFYSATEGYVAFNDYIGFTTDAGRTFVQKKISTTNVNYNNNEVNITFGFQISGVKAFDRNRLIVYGAYAKVPAILYSTDQGSTFKLVFHSQFRQIPATEIVDMSFPTNGSIGYAIDQDRILKTTDGGVNWTVIKTEFSKGYCYLRAFSDNDVVVASAYNLIQKIMRTANGGTDWTENFSPASALASISFISPLKGWVNMSDGSVHQTTDGGQKWTKQNTASLTSYKMLFVDDNTGYALGEKFNVYKTTDAGKVWERMARDNNYTDPGNNFNDIQIINNNTWVGGDYGFLQLSTDANQPLLPTASFTLDESTANTIKLQNTGKAGYTYEWYRNNKPLATTYNASYAIADVFADNDTVKLVVSNGIYKDSVNAVTTFSRGIKLTSIEPTSAKTGQTVTIRGQNFIDITSVSFGGVPATSFKVNHDAQLTAVVGAGASGSVSVKSLKSSRAIGGFTYLPPPVINSFSPDVATNLSKVILTGQNFVYVNTVYVGDRPATFKVLSAQQLEVTVPSTSLTGDIQAITEYGSGTVSGLKLLPTITASNVPSGGFGTKVSFTGLGLPLVKSVTIDGFPARQVTATSYSVDVVLGEAVDGSSIVFTSDAGTVTFKAFKYYHAPVISSFSPAAGPIGSTVTITGTNFNPVAAENIVAFGNERATVTAATATSLSVTVPAGATYKPMTVISNKNICYSSVPFIVTFNGEGTMDESTFSNKFDVHWPMGIGKIIVADLNNDNRPEIIIPSPHASGKLGYVQFNNSTPGKMSFETKDVFFTTNLSDKATSKDAAIGDYDMDGYADIYFYAMKNDRTYINTVTSQPFFMEHLDQISAAPNYDFYFDLSSVDVSDVDGDGQTDRMFGSNSRYDTYKYKNVQLVDLNADGKPDLIERKDNKVFVYRNISTKGNINFAAPVSFDPGGVPNTIGTGDFDGDGKMELAINVNAGDTGSSLRILTCSTVAGEFSFTTALNVPVIGVPNSGNAADIDGDGKPDIVIMSGSFVNIFKNTTSNGKISFAAPVRIAAPNMNAVHAADMDADGKPDIICRSAGGDSQYILRNNLNPASITAFTPLGGVAGKTITITGKGFTRASEVKIGGVPVASFTVVSDTQITAVAGTGGSGFITVYTTSGIVNSPTPYVFLTVPVITAQGPLSFDRGGEVVLGATDANTAYKYQWLKDGVAIQWADKQYYAAKDAGKYTLSVSYDTETLTSAPAYVTVNLALPVNNFKVTATGVGCKGAANGTITFTAKQLLNYIATITDEKGAVKTVTFTTGSSTTGLAAGAYNVCITVTGYAADPQCFSVIVGEPKDIKLYSAVDRATNKVDLTLSGADNYTIQLNGRSYTSTSGHISLPLQAGVNQIMVTTDKACQSPVIETINYSDKLTPYPNPFTDLINVNLGRDMVTKAEIKITDILNAHTYLIKQYNNTSGVVQLNMTELNTGIYVILITIDGKVKTYKITK